MFQTAWHEFETRTYRIDDIRHILERLHAAPRLPLVAHLALLADLLTAEFLVEPPAGRAVAHLDVGEPDRGDGDDGHCEADHDAWRLACPSTIVRGTGERDDEGL